jgi:hypothetical protein
MAKEAIDAAIGEWFFREDKYGDWRGFHEDGRRTALKTGKGKYTGMQHAQNDVLNGRILCPEWPNCQHYVDGVLSESIEACVIAGRHLRDRQAPSLRNGQRRDFRGRKE